ncbi:hypothetical protein ACFL96_07535 [Thermoproteota archaeon]
MNDLASQISDTALELLCKREHGLVVVPENPFSREELTFDYSKLDPRYHVSENPEDEIVLYKGAVRGCEEFLSLALHAGLPSHVGEVKDIIESGDHELIHELFDQHTSYYHHTGLLSSTLNPEEAQVFASTHSLVRKREDKTIYQLRIKANRCVVDCYDTGACGPSKEIFILGAILPEEISAVKIVNDDEHSELMHPNGYMIRHHPPKNSINRMVKDISNWQQMSVSNNF